MKAELLTNFIPISRKLFEHQFWSEERIYSKAEAWIDLIQSARFEASKTYVGNKVVIVKRGEFAASLRFLASRWKWGKTKVEGFLKLLEADGMIVKRTDDKTGQTIIIICNYDRYNTLKDSDKTEDKTPLRQQQDTSKTKKNKENKENNILIIKGKQKMISQPLFETLNILSSDEEYIEMLCMNHPPIQQHEMREMLKTFFVELSTRGETYKDQGDAKFHFANWLKIEIEREAFKKQKQARAVKSNHAMADYKPKVFENDNRW